VEEDDHETASLPTGTSNKVACCMLEDPTTWPHGGMVPKWAQSKWLVNRPSESRVIVEEYMVGYPTPLALHGLGNVYGPKLEGIKKGQLWRSDADVKEAQKKRRYWSERQALYQFLQEFMNHSLSRKENVELALGKLDDYPMGHFQQFIPDGMVPGQPRFPGYSILQKTWLKMRDSKAGAAKRSQAAKELAKKDALTRNA
jgi:hypothetical protein